LIVIAGALSFTCFGLGFAAFWQPVAATLLCAVAVVELELELEPDEPHAPRATVATSARVRWAARDTSGEG
jgi:hypothetical protein